MSGGGVRDALTRAGRALAESRRALLASGRPDPGAVTALTAALNDAIRAIEEAARVEPDLPPADRLAVAREAAAIRRALVTIRRLLGGAAGLAAALRDAGQPAPDGYGPSGAPSAGPPGPGGRSVERKV